MKPPPNKRKSNESRVVSAKIKRPPEEYDVEESADEEEAEPIADDGPDADEAPARKEVKGSAKGFLDQIGDTLRSAGKTAERYTRIGVSHAEIEKLRFDLKTAHANLGEVVMRCWSDAPDLGLTSRDPAIIGAYKRVKEVRRKIREKEARIASLKSEKS